jgi:hypothetical protein
MTYHIPSYPKVYNLGHKAVAEVLQGPVVIQEKYDGSQFSFCWDPDGQLYARSKGREQYGPGRTLEEVDDLFRAAVEYLLTVEPIPGEVFRCEVFKSKRHNTLDYGRAPRHGLVLFDVESMHNPSHYRAYIDEWAARLGIEDAREWVVDDGSALTLEDLQLYLNKESTLGGVKVEGIVIKNYNRHTIDGKTMMAKLVSPEFRERHERSWKKRNPNRGDVLDEIIEALNTEARWRKAVQHLREDGVLKDGPEDIGPLMREVKRDTMDEERDWIISQLAAHFLPKVERAVGRGLPEWYKGQLAAGQFDQEAE